MDKIKKRPRKKVFDPDFGKQADVIYKKEEIKKENTKPTETDKKEEIENIKPTKEKFLFSKFGRFLDRHGWKLFMACFFIWGIGTCSRIAEEDERQKKLDNICNRDIKYLKMEIRVKQGQAWLDAYRDSVYRAHFSKEK
ncbi:MAG: hypothetical protein FWG80_03635 [Alphaproteobacteria bacterium]|nr:hypothetical protein [Alphaproteobacteria bacterium]